MKKYEIKKNVVEIKNKKELQPGVTLFAPDVEPETLEVFDSKEDALKGLEKYKSSYVYMDGYTAPYYIVKEIYVQENIYDSDGDWIDGGDVWRVADFDAES